MNTSADLPIAKVRLGYSIDWIKYSWSLAKKHYGVALAVSVTFIIGALLQKIIFVGLFLSAIYNIFLRPGLYLMTQSWRHGEDVPYSRLFAGVDNLEYVKRLVPLMFLELFYNATLLLLGHFSSSGIIPIGVSGSIAAILVICYFLFISFCVPLIILKNVKFIDSLSLSFRAVTHNFFPILLGGLALGAVLVISTVLLVLPVIFVALPIFIIYPYAVYATIFDNLTIEPSKEPERIAS